MNNKRILYYPAMAYVVLLLLVWLFSWIADAVAALVGTDVEIHSLIGGEGLRWAMRSAMSSLNKVPWGTLFLCLTVVGLMKGTGIIRIVSRLSVRRGLTGNQKRALIFAVLALLLYVVAVYITALPPFKILLGVTGKFIGSPLAIGLPLLLFFGVLVFSVVYGFLYGNFRSPLDVLSSVGDTISGFVPALMALVPASGIMPCLDYVGVTEIIGLTVFETEVISVVLYAIPFMHSVYVWRGAGRSLHENS